METQHQQQISCASTSCLLVDQTGNTLHSTAASQAADSWLGDALNVIAKYLPVALGTTLSETLASFAATCR